jgi:hypothetical protein
MKLQYSLKSTFLLTAIMAALAAICTAVPVIELRDLGFPMRSLWPRQPTMAEVAFRLAWCGPLVSAYIFAGRYFRKLGRRKWSVRETDDSSDHAAGSSELAKRFPFLNLKS